MNLEFLLGILLLLPTTGEAVDCSDSPALYDLTALPKAVHALSSVGFSHVH